MWHESKLKQSKYCDQTENVHIRDCSFALKARKKCDSIQCLVLAFLYAFA